MPSAARLQAIIGDAAGSMDITDSSGASESATEPAPADPPSAATAATGVDSAADSGASADSPADPDAAASDPVASERVMRHALLEEKLAEARERRAASNYERRARAELERAQAARAQAERELADRQSKLKAGWKDGLAELGYDPLEVLRGMTEEATLAGTPEATMAKLQQDFARQLQPLQEQLEELRREKAQYQAQAQARHFDDAVTSTLAGEKYAPLTSAYESDELVTYARQAARNLTDAGYEFTATDVVDLLLAEQVKYDERVAQRRANARAATPNAIRSVNGTVERPNAATTLGNNLVSESAGESTARRLTKAERVDRLIKGMG